ncbi:septation protein imp2-like [Teratosphaeria destructans]|uniref:Septation protein imp2-like n=1 Tax=Teratosphaeria destructans TaxID=418781 RepID=A0A9W7VXT7_9PEZI|nr:septation protein imp2-like [Teratosphaeria destructans]
MGPPPASDGPTVAMSFANNFWGKDDAGVGPMLERMHNSKVTGEELKAFYTARADIEADYAKRLLNLARKPLGSCEAGTLRMSLDVVRGEIDSMGKEHQNIAGKMKSELEEPLSAFAGGLKERRKIIQGGIEKLLKVKTQQTIQVHKTRDRFEQDCLKIKGYLAQGHMVMGQEERKNKAKLEKTQIQMSANSSEYETAVKVLEETTGKWNREWKAACDKFQDLEEERLDYFKSSLWNFANISSTVCVSDDASCEKIRLSLEDCDVEKDISNFIKDSGTGQEIPDPPKYINFCRGDADDAMSRADSEDGDYSVAQFQRTMNPSYRTSSPQPSTLDMHHDPDSSLREAMGLPKARASLQGDEAFAARVSSGSAGFDPRGSQGSGFNPRSSHGSAAPPPLAPSASSSIGDPYANAPRIPHNPYPTEGMTQFCRPPSERSSQPSPTRPDSRESQDHGGSDYSAPTSFSSMEPPSGHVSPTKGYNGSNVSGVSSGAEDKTIQKKKSGFFNSPFRRRSQKLKEQPQPTQPTPTQRNTWTPANMRDTNTSPSKPLATNRYIAAAVQASFISANFETSLTISRSSTWQKKSSPSPDPDVDPRADYQLGIGNNVFDVESPNKRKPTSKKADPELDPIAQALAELKGVTKQASVRQPIDRHYGMSTPAPGTPAFDGRGTPAGAVPTPFASSGNRGTPPPAYDTPPVSRLGAPQPAHTKREMQKTTAQFINQKRDMFNGPAQSARPGSAMARGQSSQGQPPRASSPQPPRATSPRPGYQQGGLPYRAASPNPYGGAPQPAVGSQRPRAQSSSPIKPQPNYGGYNSRNGSPGGYQVPRAASPNPAYTARPPAASISRPGSSQGAMVLAPVSGDPYGSQRGARPQSSHYGDYGQQHQMAQSRTRSQSVAGQRQVTRDGRPIMHFARAMYMYQAAIPEELSFAKGDVLAVIRHQDDGWWEAEVCNKPGQPGLVPSNYLKEC